MGLCVDIWYLHWRRSLIKDDRGDQEITERVSCFLKNTRVVGFRVSMSQSKGEKNPSPPPICLTIGINFKSGVRLPDERNCFSDFALPARALTVEMKLTHNRVPPPPLYLGVQYTHGFLSVICHSPLSRNSVWPCCCCWREPYSFKESRRSGNEEGGRWIKDDSQAHPRCSTALSWWRWCTKGGGANPPYKVFSVRNTSRVSNP